MAEKSVKLRDNTDLIRIRNSFKYAFDLCPDDPKGLTILSDSINEFSKVIYKGIVMDDDVDYDDNYVYKLSKMVSELCHNRKMLLILKNCNDYIMNMDELMLVFMSMINTYNYKPNILDSGFDTMEQYMEFNDLIDTYIENKTEEVASDYLDEKFEKNTFFTSFVEDTLARVLPADVMEKHGIKNQVEPSSIGIELVKSTTRYKTNFTSIIYSMFNNDISYLKKYLDIFYGYYDPNMAKEMLLTAIQEILSVNACELNGEAKVVPVDNTEDKIKSINLIMSLINKIDSEIIAAKASD